MANLISSGSVGCGAVVGSGFVSDVGFGGGLTVGGGCVVGCGSGASAAQAVINGNDANMSTKMRVENTINDFFPIICSSRF